MLPQPSPAKLNHIIDLKHIIYSTQQIYKYTEEIRNAYEHLIQRYEIICKENVELKSGSTKTTVESVAPTSSNLGHKRRKTDESVNDSLTSNDILNEAIQDISSCVEDEIIESTPKPDISRKNVSKKITAFKSPIEQNEIKVEKFDDSKDEALVDAQKVEVNKKQESPLRSVENQGNFGKENRQKHPMKWISNTLVSPSRVSRSGFISTKSPKGVARLSLSRPFKQSLLEFARNPVKETATDVKKPSKETPIDTCFETFFDGTPPKQIDDVRRKFHRQQCLEACITPSKDSDDENVFSFKSNANASSTSPPNIKLEPQTDKALNVSPTNIEVKVENNQRSYSSSVEVLSGVKDEVIVIEESQPLFEDCSETFLEKIELNIQAVESSHKISGNEEIVANHNILCRQCRVFMEYIPSLTMKQKLGMIDRCQKYSMMPDTDLEYWYPRFLPITESHKTLIELKIQAVESLANAHKISSNEEIVANHNILCRLCRVFMESNPHLTMEHRLGMIDRCQTHAIRPDTDSEYWNPRFLPTPESQKQETLIDDRWAARKGKP